MVLPIKLKIIFFIFLAITYFCYIPLVWLVFIWECLNYLRFKLFGTGTYGVEIHVSFPKNKILCTFYFIVFTPYFFGKIRFIRLWTFKPFIKKYKFKWIHMFFPLIILFRIPLFLLMIYKFWVECLNLYANDPDNFTWNFSSIYEKYSQ